MPGYALAGFALMASLALIAFAGSFEFARKEQASGFLVPAAGWSRVLASNVGVVRSRLVEPGDKVEVGDVLLELGSQDGLQRALTVHEKLLVELAQRQKSLEGQMKLVRSQYEQGRALLLEETASDELQLGLLMEELGVSAKQVTIAQSHLRAGRELYASGALPRSDLLHLSEELQSHALSFSERRREAERSRRRIRTKGQRLRRLAIDNERERIALQERIHVLEMEESRTRMEGGAHVLAPRAGIVASIRVRPGDRVHSGSILLDILPEESPLQARLFVPSSAMGFVTVGQEVRVYLDAFPYERHGAQVGRVASVSESTLMPGEVLEFGKHQNVGLPSFQVDVEFPEGIRITGVQPEAARKGMTVTADLVRDYGTLVDWVMEPLRGVGERL